MIVKLLLVPGEVLLDAPKPTRCHKICMPQGMLQRVLETVSKRSDTCS